jgi:hypothetical protein
MLLLATKFNRMDDYPNRFGQTVASLEVQRGHGGGPSVLWPIADDFG